MRSLGSLGALWRFPLCVALFSTLSFAQDLDDVTFSGTVTDQHGALLPGATVAALSSATKAGRSVLTDGGGRYRLVELPPGTYTLRVTAAGFNTQERADLLTPAGQNIFI